MRTDKYKLDENGDPIPCDDILEWGRWFETSNRHVARTEIVPGVVVSTVFLGLDHNFGALGPPVLWETMVSAEAPEFAEHNQRCWRYADNRSKNTATRSAFVIITT